MLIYFGIQLIHPNYIYVIAFFLTIMFSSLTGTSWGSIGTIGVVIISISLMINADIGITAGAIIGGAYFGDKLSPLSDTTNLAAIATNVGVTTHIRSMLVTTLPSAFLAALIFFLLGISNNSNIMLNSSNLKPILDGIISMFNFNSLLLLPPIIVLFGSLNGMKIIPIFLISSCLSIILCLIFQSFSFHDIFISLYKGFNINMSLNPKITNEDQELFKNLFNRGGVYAMKEVIFFTFMVLIFVGSNELIGSIKRTINKILRFIKYKYELIIFSLFASAFTNSLTSNQSATSFIVGESLSEKFNSAKISRNILSRSIEDYGTILESLIPWHASTYYITQTINVPIEQYWRWHFFALINIIIAPLIILLQKKYRKVI